MNEHEQTLDNNTILKQLERLRNYKGYMMEPCEEEAMLCAIRHYRELVEAEKAHHID